MIRLLEFRQNGARRVEFVHGHEPDWWIEEHPDLRELRGYETLDDAEAAGWQLIEFIQTPGLHGFHQIAIQRNGAS